MQAVGIGVRQNTNLVITQPRKVAGTRLDAERHTDVVHFLRPKHLGRFHFPGIKYFSTQRQNRLKFAVTRLFRRATGGIAFDQKQFRPFGIATGAIGKLARQGRAGRNFLAHHLLAELETLLRIFDCQLRDLFAGFGVLIEPQAECVLDDAGYESRGFA